MLYKIAKLYGKQHFNAQKYCIYLNQTTKSHIYNYEKHILRNINMYIGSVSAIYIHTYIHH